MNLEKRYMDVGGLKLYEYISKWTVIGQSEAYTCVATSLKMVLEGKGIIISEEIIAKALQTTSDGASIFKIEEALQKLRLSNKIGCTLRKEIKIEQFILELKVTEIAIVSVKAPGKATHALIVDKINAGKVFCRDPLPLGTGSSYSIEIKDFKMLFNERCVFLRK